MVMWGIVEKVAIQGAQFFVRGMRIITVTIPIVRKCIGSTLLVYFCKYAYYMNE